MIKKNNVAQIVLLVLALTLLNSSVAFADISREFSFTGNSGSVREVEFEAQDDLTTVGISVDYNNQGNFAFASDLIVGVIDPNGNAIEIGPFVNDPGSLDGYDGITFADAGNFPSGWRTDSNGGYSIGQINVSSFGLSGAGTWRVVATSAFSQTARWDINLSLGGISLDAAATVPTNVTFLGNSGDVEEMSFAAQGNLTSVNINVNFNNQGNFAFASDLVVGIVDPSGNAIEVGPFVNDSGTLNGYDGLSFTKASTFPSSWRTDSNGAYAHGPVNVNSFSLSGTGNWRLMVTSGFSQVARWNITLALTGLSEAADSDSDGAFDFEDNCTSIANANQNDSDGDGFGDACDTCPGGDDAIDSDLDGVPDDCDSCPNSVNVTNLSQGTVHGTIAEAVVDASANDVLEIGDCTLYESGIILNKSLTIRGQGATQSVVDSDLSDTTFLIQNFPTIRFQDMTMREGIPTMGNGGGAIHSAGGSLHCTRVVFRDCNGVAAVNSDSSSSTHIFEQCRFLNNNGAGFASAAAGFASTTMINCLFSGNNGADATVNLRRPSDIINCTFADNTDTRAIDAGSGSDANVQNCIFDMENVVGTIGSGIITVNNSLFVGGTGTNIDGTATFVDSANQDFRLVPGSLGVDVGDYDEFTTAGGGMTDLNGDIRVFDSCVADSGSGSITYLDMGAYELQNDSGDTDGDGVADNCELCNGDDATGDSDGDGFCDNIDNCVLINNPAQIDSELPSPSLSAVSAWRMEENSGTILVDQVGDSDGVVNGAARALGRQGAGLDFDGSVTSNNQHVNLGETTALDGTSEFTVAFWFQRRSDRTGDANSTNHNIDNVMVAKSSANNNDNLEIGSTGSNIEIYLDTTGLDSNIPYLVPNVVVDDIWTHFALTYDSNRSNEVKVYIDGGLAAQEGQWSGSIDVSSGSPLTLGLARPNSANPWGDFDGLLDEVAVFEKALSDDEVAQLFLGLGDGQGDACDLCVGDDATGDSDSDSICDDIDICTGFDDTIDSDGDGIADGCDLCFGDNAFGDSDNNGLCDEVQATDWEMGVEGVFSGSICGISVMISPVFNGATPPTADMSGPEFSFAPLSPMQERVGYSAATEWTATFDPPVDDLLVYVSSWRGAGSLGVDPQTYTFDLPFTVASGISNGMVVGNTLELPGGFHRGILRFAGPISTLSLTTSATDTGAAQSVTFAAILGDADEDFDGVVDVCDVCPGFDDNIDVDGNGTPDGCDATCGDGRPRGDVDGDSIVSTNDLPAFASVLVDPSIATANELCAADVNQDGESNGLDIQDLLELLLGS